MSITANPLQQLSLLTGYGPELGDAFRNSRILAKSSATPPVNNASNFEQSFAKWFASTPNIESICFCDITYFPDPNPATAFTIVLAKSSQSMTRYQKLLQSYIQNGWSMVVHPAFKKGLSSDGSPRFLRSYLTERDPDRKPKKPKKTDNEDIQCVCVPTYQKWWKPSPYFYKAEEPIEKHWREWGDLLSRDAASLQSSRHGNLRTILGIPVGSLDWQIGGTYHLAGSIFLGFDEFCTDAEVQTVSRYILLQVLDTCGVPELARLSSTTAREQFSHVFQGFANPISTAVSQLKDCQEKAAAMTALRHMQFHINLFSESRPFRLIASPQDPMSFISLDQCIEDALTLAFDRLNSRCSIGETKKIDEQICNLSDDPVSFDDKIKLRLLNHLAGDDGWTRNRNQLLIQLGGDSLLELKKVRVRVTWDECAEEGLYVLVLREVFFHAIVYLAAQPLFAEFVQHFRELADNQHVVRIKWNDSFSDIRISNARPARLDNYDKTKDCATLKQICSKFNEAQREWISVSWDSTEERVAGYFTISIKIDRD